RPRLTIEAGNDGQFHKRVTMAEIYDRVKDLMDVKVGKAYVVETTPIKLLKVSNASEVGIQEVRVSITDSNRPEVFHFPFPLLWFHDDKALTDLAPLASGWVTLGWRVRLE